jgi:hypothetical protein
MLGCTPSNLDPLCSVTPPSPRPSPRSTALKGIVLLSRDPTPRARESAPEPIEQLEPRRYLSFIYEGFTPLLALNDPRPLGDGYFGPVAVIADVDADGVRDVLVGNSALFVNGGTSHDLGGAAVFSGRTGATLRTYGAPPNSKFGWSVADIGDADGDGVSDYAVGTAAGGTSSASLYSGATGARIRTVSGGEPAGGAIVSAVGDINGDGRADLLVGYAGDNRGVVYSGADGLVLLQLTAPPLSATVDLGVGARAGRDLNGDGVPDIVLASATAAGQPDPRLWAFSGADGSVLWSTATPDIRDLFTAEAVYTITPDLSGDGVPDIVFTHTTNTLRVLSGADGSLVRDTLLGPADRYLGRDIAPLGDLDGDGVPDLAVGAPNIQPDHPGAWFGGIYIVSGASGALITTLRHTGNQGDLNAHLGDALTAADLNGDGLLEVVAVARRDAEITGPAFSRVFVFDGDRLLPAAIGGTTSGSISRSIAWGTIGGEAFLLRDGRTTILTAPGLLASGDVIIDVFETGDDTAVLAAAVDGSNPFVLIARAGDFDFQHAQRFDLSSFTPSGGPSGAYTNLRAIAVATQPVDPFHRPIASHVALLERTLDGATPTAWLADLEAMTLAYLFTGTPVGLAIDPLSLARIVIAVGAASDRPGVGLLWLNGVLSDLPAVPVALNDPGTAAAGIRAGTGGAHDDAVLIGISGFPALTVLPPLPGGESFVPVGVNRFGEVTGTYTITATGQRSAFYLVNRTQSMFDLRSAADVLGEPDDYTTTAVEQVTGPTDAGDVLVGQLAVGTPRTALLTVADAAGPDGPFRAAAAAQISIALSPSGDVVIVTVNEAGEVIELSRVPGPAPQWGHLDFRERFIFSQPHSGGVTLVSGPGGGVALARPEGLLLLYPTPGDHGGGWTVRNLTADIQGAQPIVGNLTLLKLLSGLQIIAGFNAQSELVLYGQTPDVAPQGGGQLVWSFDNLYQTVVFAQGLPSPDLVPSLGIISYVTAWGGLNIAGLTPDGSPAVFWTSPAITGWRVANLSVFADGVYENSHNFLSLAAALTPWSGINLYGEGPSGRIQVLWWVPQFGGRWRADLLAPDAPNAGYPSGTLTAFAQPWGGLNVARVDPQGRVEIWWWSPESNVWTRQTLNDSIPAHAAGFRATGKLESAVSAAGQTNILARNELGDIFRFFWTPGQDWSLERI